MTVFEAVDVLREFRQLKLGPELSEAIDVIGRHFDEVERVVGSAKVTLTVVTPTDGDAT